MDANQKFDFEKVICTHIRKYISACLLKKKSKEKIIADITVSLKNNEWFAWAFYESKRGNASDKIHHSSPTLKENYCYYNALRYVHTHSGADLAVGVALHKNQWDLIQKWNPKNGIISLNSNNGLYVFHAFTIEDGSIVDPTPMDTNDLVYVWSVIPKEIWKKFPYSTTSSSKKNDVSYEYVENYFSMLVRKHKGENSKLIDYAKKLLEKHSGMS